VTGKPLPMERRLVALMGELGSGKTEIALHYAQCVAESRRPVAVVDLDVVNPYFRVLDHRLRLEREGLRVIAPASRFAASDTPAIPAEAMAVFQEPGWWGIFDVGGGPAGARALGRFAALFGEYADQYAGWVVVNARRPTTQTEDDIAAMIRQIEATSSLPATGLVSNTHLCDETTPEHILAGHALISAAGRALGLPVVFLAADRRWADGLPVDCPVLPLRRRVRLPWDRGSGEES
jgi:hypothetical protein